MLCPHGFLISFLFNLIEFNHRYSFGIPLAVGWSRWLLLIFGYCYELRCWTFQWSDGNVRHSCRYRSLCYYRPIHTWHFLDFHNLKKIVNRFFISINYFCSSGKSDQERELVLIGFFWVIQGWGIHSIIIWSDHDPDNCK